MKTVALADFSEVLLALYRRSSELGLEEFQDAALELVRPLVPFDTSMWGTATMTDAGRRHPRGSPAPHLAGDARRV